MTAEHTRHSSPGHAILLAVGNSGYSDDGFGPALLRYYLARHQLPEWLHCIDAASRPLGHYQRLSQCQWLILLDAVLSESPPTGADPELLLYDRLSWPALSNMLRPPSAGVSSHQLSLPDLLQLMASLGQLPPRLTLLGARMQTLTPGFALSESLQHRLPEAALQLDRLLTSGISCQ